jgi:lactate permease
VACLVINSTPTVFGSVGVPATTLAGIAGLDILTLTRYAATIQFVLTFLSPFLAVIIIGGGLKAMKGMFPFTLIASLSFVIPQFLTAAFIGAELPNILGSIISMVIMVAAAKLLPHQVEPEYLITSSGKKEQPMTLQKGLTAWAPFIFTFLFLLLTSNLVPVIHDPLAAIKSSVQVYAGENPGTLNFFWINTPGIIIFIASFCGSLIQKASPATMWKVLCRTVKNNVKTILTVCSVLAVAKIMGYSGMISAIAAVLVQVTGSFFPLFSPLIGVIGGFVTGSGTSTAVLFGSLQAQTAQQIGSDPAWLCAANEMGGGVGKMLCPQSIAIGCAAVDLSGKDGELMGKIAPYAFGFLALMMIEVYVGVMMGL